jgi:hypothetical protein
MDVSTGGAISAITHVIEQQSLATTLTKRSVSGRSFESFISEELSRFYSTAYRAAHWRHDAGQPHGAMLIQTSRFDQLLGRRGTDNPLARIAVLFAMNLLNLEFGNSPQALSRRFQRSAMLTTLLKTGHGTVEGLSFAMLTVDAEGGRHAVGDVQEAARLARLLFAFQKLSHDLQQYLRNALKLFLLGDAASIGILCEPSKFEQLLGSSPARHGTE